MANGSYCGGTEPSLKMMEALQKEHPQKGIKVFIKADSINTDSLPILYQTVTDENGCFTLWMKPGRYSVYIDEQGGPSVFDASRYVYSVAVITACWKEWWQTPQRTFMLSETTTLPDFHFTRNCMVQSFCPCILSPEAMRAQ